MTAEPAANRLAPGTVAALYAGFLLTGTATVILGPLLPHLHARTGVPLPTLSWLFLVQFASHSLGAVASSANVRRSLITGYPLAAAGLLGLLLGWPWALGAVTVMGFGLGLVIPSTNILVARRHPHRRAAALSHLNILWGAGAVSAPLVFAALKTGGAPGLGPLLIAVPFVVLGVLLPTRVPVIESVRAAAGAAPISVAALALIALQMFLYTGSESSVGGWIISLAAEYVPAGSTIPQIMGGSFWAALLTGRALAPLLLQRFGERRVYAGTLAVAALAAAALLSAASIAGLWAATVLAGLAFAPVFPILAAGLVEYTHERRPAAAGPVFAIAGFGAGAVPWLAGQVVALAGGVRAALVVPAIGVALLLLLAVTRGPHPAPPSVQ
jgi:MFS transporter, FHS family, glucose/mannose:H+ symporter